MVELTDIGKEVSAYNDRKRYNVDSKSNKATDTHSRRKAAERKRTIMTEAARRARREYNREWHKRNRERRLEYEREWRRNNPDKVQAQRERYWQKKADQAAAAEGMATEAAKQAGAEAEA